MHPLRDLADQILELCRKHPAYSQGIPIVQNCVDHLCAVAGCHEANQKVATLERSCDPN